MNEFLRELATLGLGMGALVVLGTCGYLAQRNVREKFARKRDERVRQVLLVLLAAACLGIAAWLLPLLDAPRRPLLDYVGILLAFACLCAAVALALDLLAGMQLRLRGAVPVGAFIQAGDYAGQVSRCGLLQVVITTADGDRVHLPNRYLLQVPIRQIARGSGHDEVKTIAHGRLTDVVGSVPSVVAAEAAPGFWPTSSAPVVAERREPIITATDQAADSVGQADPGMTAAPAVSEPAQPLLDPHTAAELARLRNEYTELSQQLLDVERALQAAGQGEERQRLSLEKKKMEARLFRLDKQISQFDAGERRRA